ncbi:unnamed protein product [Symbiodinium sp. CCMP2592]|nr:unnamed protein product [Symbiodinium sp. CCMP2592]
MAFQHKLPSYQGKFMVLQHGSRWGAYFLPAGLPSLPTDASPFRLWDTAIVQTHLLDSFTRNELTRKADELNVALPAGKLNKTTLSGILANYLTKPLDAEFANSTTPMGALPVTRDSDALRFLETQNAEISKGITKEENKKCKRLAKKVVNVLLHDTDPDAQKLVKQLLSLSPSDIVSIRNMISEGIPMALSSDTDTETDKETITLLIGFKDMRTDVGSFYGNFVQIDIDPSLSASSLGVAILEGYDQQMVGDDPLNLGDRDFKQVLYLGWSPETMMPLNDPIRSLSSWGIGNHDKIEMRIFNEGDKRFLEFWGVGDTSANEQDENVLMLLVKGKDFDKQTINTIPSSEKKGTMTIKLCDKVVFYEFGERNTVGDACKALADHFGAELDFGPSGNYRMKYLNSPSTLYLYQSIWAELAEPGQTPNVEVVPVGLRGGGKASVIKAKEKSETYKRRASEMAKKVLQSTKTTISDVGVLEAMMTAFHQKAETNPADAFADIFKSHHSVDSINSLLEAMDEVGGNSGDVRVRKLCPYLVGPLMNIDSQIKSLEAVKESVEASMCWGYNLAVSSSDDGKFDLKVLRALAQSAKDRMLGALEATSSMPVPMAT